MQRQNDRYSDLAGNGFPIESQKWQILKKEYSYKYK